MNLVLFLGAGFSAPFGQPVMDEFLGFADASTRLSEPDKSLLGKLVLEARRANAFLESSATNLEDILSFSEMGERLGLTDDDRSTRLRKILGAVYTTPRLPISDYWTRYDPFLSLLGGRIDNVPALSVITTNYDLNAESALKKVQRPPTLGFEFSRVPLDFQSTGKLYEESGTNLFKLHGSVNWFQPAEGGSDIVVDDYVTRSSGFSEADIDMPHVCFDNVKPEEPPIIVPPSFLKPELQRPLRAIWEGAAKALSVANVVAFVGYSFPPSDTEMTYFLARAFMENPGLRAIFVLDPNASEIVQRLRESGSGFGSHFRSLLRPLPGNWTSTELPLRV